jgi:hypothetical protein
MLETWRAVLEALAREYLSGHAAVAPKNYPETCRHCDFPTLCRVRELMDRGPVGEEDFEPPLPRGERENEALRGRYGDEGSAGKV